MQGVSSAADALVKLRDNRRQRNPPWRAQRLLPDRVMLAHHDYLLPIWGASVIAREDEFIHYSHSVEFCVRRVESITSLVAPKFSTGHMSHEARNGKHSSIDGDDILSFRHPRRVLQLRVTWNRTTSVFCQIHSFSVCVWCQTAGGPPDARRWRDFSSSKIFAWSSSNCLLFKLIERCRSCKHIISINTVDYINCVPCI